MLTAMAEALQYTMQGYLQNQICQTTGKILVSI